MRQGGNGSLAAGQQQASGKAAPGSNPVPKESEDAEDAKVLPPQVVTGAFLVPVDRINDSFMQRTLDSMSKPPLDHYVEPVLNAGDPRQPRDSHMLHLMMKKAAAGTGKDLYAKALDSFLIEPAFTLDMSDHIAVMRDFLRDSFNDDGIFGMKSIAIQQSEMEETGGRVFKLPAFYKVLGEPAAVARVYVHPKDPYPYVIEFHRPFVTKNSTEASDSKPIVVMSFATLADGRNIKVLLDVYETVGIRCPECKHPEDILVQQYSYDTRYQRIDLHGGILTDAPVDTATNYALVMSYEFGPKGSKYFGAEQYATRDFEDENYALPRPMQQRGGDVFVSRSAAHLAVGEATLGEQAFIPADRRLEMPKTVSPALWNDFDVGKAQIQAVLDELRDPKTYTDCAKGGDAFKKALTAAGIAALPVMAQALPADLCFANTALSDEALKKALFDACLLPEFPAWTVTLARHAVPVEVNVCFDLYVGMILGNRQSVALTLDKDDKSIQYWLARFFNADPHEMLDRKPLDAGYAALEPLLTSIEVSPLDGLARQWIDTRRVLEKAQIDDAEQIGQPYLPEAERAPEVPEAASGASGVSGASGATKAAP